MVTKTRARAKAVTGHKGFPRWELRLYVENWEPRSAAAIVNLKRLCEQHLPGKYRIQVVDLVKTPHRSHEDQILALPTVVRRLPLPERRVIGTLANAEAVAAALELRAAISA
jgi:circadian clock protein KaiB